MADPFFIKFDRDDKRLRLTLTVTGQIESKCYADQCLAFYSQIPEFEKYDRLIDFSASAGFVTFEDLKMLADFWNRAHVGMARISKVAVVTKKALINARMGLVDGLSIKENHRSFSSIAEADAWLSTPG